MSLMCRGKNFYVAILLSTGFGPTSFAGTADLYKSCTVLGTAGQGAKVAVPGQEGDRMVLLALNPPGSIKVNIQSSEMRLFYSYDQFLPIAQKSDDLTPSCRKAVNEVVEPAQRKWQKVRDEFIDQEKAIDKKYADVAYAACGDQIKQNEGEMLQLRDEVNALYKFPGKTAQETVEVMNRRNQKLIEGAVENPNGIAAKSCNNVVKCVGEFVEKAKKDLEDFQSKQKIDDVYKEKKDALQKQISRLFDKGAPCESGGYGAGPGDGTSGGTVSPGSEN